MKLYLTLFLFISSLLFSKENSLYVCTIFHNEARFLDEWVSFHLQQGVDRIYMYNNNSDDDYMKSLKKYIRGGKVILFQWNKPHGTVEEWNKVQCAAYMDCIEKIKDQCEWCAFIDTDEFLFNPEGISLKNILKKFKHYDAVGVNWVMYGSSYLKRIPDGAKMIDYLKMRAPMDIYYNRFYKSIVRPAKVSGCTHIHYFTMLPGSKCVNEKKMPIEGWYSDVSVDLLRINHYWTRDLDFLYEEKLKRQNKWYKTEDLRDRDRELNVVYDPILSNIRD